MSKWDREIEQPPIDTAIGTFVHFSGGDGCISADTKRFYTIGADTAPSPDEYAIGWINTDTNLIEGYVTIGSSPPSQLQVSPDDLYAYTIRQVLAPNEVRKYSLTDGSLVATATPVGSLLNMLDITPDGAYLLYSAQRNAVGGISSNIWKIRTSDMAILATLTSAGGGSFYDDHSCFTSDSSIAYVSGRKTGTLAPSMIKIDMASFTVMSVIQLPTGYEDQSQCWINDDDTTLWVTAQRSLPATVVDVVMPLDLASETWGPIVDLNTSTRPISASPTPVRFFMSDDESTILFFHLDGYWRAVDVATGAFIKTVFLSDNLADEMTWHNAAKINDVKYYAGASNAGPAPYLWVYPQSVTSFDVVFPQ